ncbi:hypothetical protein Kpho01_68080 [Kitasatospora phosalacinea]|uniref:Uncharacterized protein n=1 Tax=Kitasatospora phosalacinea TaxID=2065 RepID=A0A9W6UT50_9ACTN|nr:hypothetical protein Kpho01_68080 [Kitasatospora phosalacinea]
MDKHGAGQVTEGVHRLAPSHEKETRRGSVAREFAGAALVRCEVRSEVRSEKLTAAQAGITPLKVP